jgi:NAD(P)H-dependent flavin oxidoreductase YrpB (nitropropane dioxygenase family)
MLKTRFCELFGVELPIMLAGMGTIALADLAAAVSDGYGGAARVHARGNP